MKRVRQLLPGLLLAAVVWVVVSVTGPSIALTTLTVILAVFAVLIAMDTGVRPYQQPYRIIAFFGAVTVAVCALTVFTVSPDTGMGLMRGAVILGSIAVAAAWYYQRRNLRTHTAKN